MMWRIALSVYMFMVGFSSIGSNKHYIIDSFELLTNKL